MLSFTGPKFKRYLKLFFVYYVLKYKGAYTESISIDP
jgi:hypothetical protein